jgi:hypothetical protein
MQGNSLNAEQKKKGRHVNAMGAVPGDIKKKC